MVNIIGYSEVKKQDDLPLVSGPSDQEVLQEKQTLDAMTTKVESEQKGELATKMQELHSVEVTSEFGEANINNPKILDLIAEIESGSSNPEFKEQTIAKWKREIGESQLKEAKRDLKYQNGLIYGFAGWNRYSVSKDGVVRLSNVSYATRALPDAMSRAISLGMEIEGSPIPYTD